MSVNGVAIATVVSNLTSSLILLVRLTRTQKWIRVQLSELRIHKDCLLKILRIGLPAGIQSAVFNIANVVILASGKFLLSLFNSDPQVIEIGYTRLLIIFSAYTFSMLYEVMSGYLRGFGISFVPAILTTIGVCGTRLAWVFTVFPHHRNFASLMLVYPVSLSTTAVLIFIVLMVYRPARRFQTVSPNTAKH